MLGGYPQVSRIDIAGSRAFLAKLRRLPSPPTPDSANDTGTPPLPPAKLRLVADCGAGIGRITTNFLVTVAEHVDVVEPVKKFTDQLREEHPDLFIAKGEDEAVVTNIFNVPLEAWNPPTERLYDVIWNQWCLGHLPDAALIAYLKRLIPNLTYGGYIVVKENLSTDQDGEDEFDETDSSVTRSEQKFESIFEHAGLKVRRTEMQKGGFGKGLGLMPVRMWGLQPEKWWEGQKMGEDGE
jgi:protein N-terminal methyltransferase